MTTSHLLTASQRETLTAALLQLIDGKNARVIVHPQQAQSGFWFGGGNVAADGNRLLLCGRYRNAGDSRTGTAAGVRGLELAVFESTDEGDTWSKLFSRDKASLTCSGGAVLSIEGTALHRTGDVWRLYVSTEKTGVNYPDSVREFLKPGAGVWSIDLAEAESPEALRSAEVRPVLSSDNPEHLHLKDPFIWRDGTGEHLGFCSHPFNWSASNTCVAELGPHGAGAVRFGYFPRGNTWDVAMTRGTCVLPLPRVGQFADAQYRVLFYCGGECLRPLEEHAAAVRRPRGWSCEEIGGAAVMRDDRPGEFERLSDLFPLFISDHGTRCSRYIDVVETRFGLVATWQQSQPDLSQPLVMNRVSTADFHAALR